MEERPRQRLSFDRQGEIDCTISIGEGFPDAQLFKFVLQSLPVQPHGERRLAYISAVTIQDPQEVIPLESRPGLFVGHVFRFRGGCARLVPDIEGAYLGRQILNIDCSFHTQNDTSLHEVP